MAYWLHAIGDAEQVEGVVLERGGAIVLLEVVQRGDQTEVLAGPEDPADLWVQQFHGSRRVDIRFTEPQLDRTYTWGASSWLAQPRLPHPLALEESRRGDIFPFSNHDADSVLVTLRNQPAAQVFVARRDTVTATQLDTVARLSGYIGARAVYSPIGDVAYVGIEGVGSSGDITVHSVDLATGVTSPIVSTTVLPGTFPLGINLYLAVSEDGRELLLQRNVTDGGCTLDYVEVSTGQIQYSRAITSNFGAASGSCAFYQAGFSPVSGLTPVIVGGAG